MNIDVSALKSLATTIRVLSAEAVEKANSGHPGLPMGAADYASLLWSYYLRFDSKDPGWINRDRFVLSAGHGCMLLYSLLHLFEYDLPLDEIKRFRQWGSKTPGHPEFRLTPGVETTTGPLGQGFANGVGMGISAKLLAEEYGQDLFDHRIYAIVSDGDLMEGVASEAASIAGHLKLGNLIYIYDDNHISIGGKTEVCFTESVPKRFESYGWFVQSADGHDVEAMKKCLDKALEERGRPSIICARTTIGFGSPGKAGDPEVHGAPLGKDELVRTKENLGWKHQESFFIPPEVRSFCAARVSEKREGRRSWDDHFEAWKSASKSKAEALDRQCKREVPMALQDDLLATFKDQKKDATRNLSGKAIQTIAKHVPFFVGGSADLEPSTKTLIKDSTDVQAGSFKGRNLRFGVREHAMGSIVNGLAYTGAWIPFSATFMVFSDYMRPSIRLAAISELQSLFIFTHESFQVGEDGPTHEPIEHIASLRAIPNLRVYRPADGVEIAMCYWAALQNKKGPSVLLFTRQNLEPWERPAGFKPQDVLKGAYTAYGAGDDLVIVATGSEVPLAVDAAKLLQKDGIAARVVSAPCIETLFQQDKQFIDSLIPPKAKKVSLEAGTTFGWERVVGCGALKIGIDHFGASAPAGELATQYGFVPDAVAAKIRDWLK